MVEQTTDYTTQIIKQLLTAWASHNKSLTKFFAKYEESIYQKEIAPGRNRAIYLLGHLIAVSDGMLPLFMLGERLYPQLEPTFITAPDKSVEDFPTLGELKQYWETLNETLTTHFNNMTAEDWMSRHSAVSEEAFKQEPHRNKLNVLISRTNHMSYHLGQLNLIKE